MLRPVLADLCAQVLYFPHNKGKSLLFEVFIWVGYVFGITRKVLLWQMAEGAALGFMFWLGAFFYVFNLLAISVDMLLYLRNARLDKKRDAEAAK